MGEDVADEGQISDTKVNPGRRETAPEPAAELAKSIAAVGLLNPVMPTRNYTLAAGLHRLVFSRNFGENRN